MAALFTPHMNHFGLQPAASTANPAVPRGPRPIEGQDGNWKCGVCAEINFASRTECHRCKSPYATAALNTGGFGAGFGGTSMPMGNAKFGGAPIEGVGGNWRCTTCANVNFAKREHCNRCQASRPPIDHILAREQELEQERAVAAASGATLQIGQLAGRKFAPPIAGVDGNWECLTCMSVNFASREQCHRCGATRPPQEHIKRRAEQIKAERAVQLATSNSLCGGALGGGANSASSIQSAALPGAALPGAALPAALPSALPGGASSLSISTQPKPLNYFANPDGTVGIAPSASSQSLGQQQQLAQVQAVQQREREQASQQLSQQLNQALGGDAFATASGTPLVVGGSLPSNALSTQPALNSMGQQAVAGGFSSAAGQGGGGGDDGIQQPNPQLQSGLFSGAPVGGTNSLDDVMPPPYRSVDVVGAANWSTLGSGALEAESISDPISGTLGGVAIDSDAINGKRPRLDEAALRRKRVTRGMPLRGGDCSSWVAGGGLVYFSQQSGAGITGLTEGCDLVASHAQRQTLSALSNLEALLATAGTTKERLIEVTLTVSRHEDLESVQAGCALLCHDAICNFSPP